MRTPVVAIVGRPNVGKSMLFNRIAGKRIAIVEDLPGTTRDRVYAVVTHGDRKFVLIDTGGLEMVPGTRMGMKIADQVKLAIDEADVIAFTVDAREGLLPADHEIADLLRASGKAVLMAVNKIDGAAQESEVHQFYKLGIGDPIPISAYHGRGVEDLLDGIKDKLPEEAPVPEGDRLLRLAILGRPNVGKSMLLNALLGRDQVIVDETPGTTRDAIAIKMQREGHEAMLIDTAGLKRPGRIAAGVDRFSSLRTIQAVEDADVAALVIDGSEGFAAQDQHIAGFIAKAFKGMICVVNKWDIVEDKNPGRWLDYTRQNLRFAPYAPVLFISAKTGYGVDKILSEAERIFEERRKVIPAAELERLLTRVLAGNPPPTRGNRRLKIYRLQQTGTNPPSFEFLANDARLVHFSYRRYLENELRKAFEFYGTPVRISVRGKEAKR